MHSSKSVGRYDPQRGFTIEIRSIVDGGDYYCRPNPPFPHNEEEMTSIEVRFIGNGHIDSEFLHPKVCDLWFPSIHVVNIAFHYSTIQLYLESIIVSGYGFGIGYGFGFAPDSKDLIYANYNTFSSKFFGFNHSLQPIDETTLHAFSCRLSHKVKKKVLGLNFP